MKIQLLRTCTACPEQYDAVWHGIWIPRSQVARQLTVRKV